MTRTAIAVSLVIALGIVSWGAAQGPQVVDLRNARQELEIMRGILQTTLSFVMRDIRQREAGAKTTESRGRVLWSGGSDIDAFYLQGQGAVFVVSTSGLRMRISERAEGYLLANEALMDAQADYAEAMAVQQELMRSVGGVQGGVVGGVQAGTPPPPPEPPQPPQVAPARSARQAQPAVKPEEMRKKLAEAQEKVKQRQEELKARQKKFQEYLGEVKVHLVEALANHGDSLSIVRPGEYINLIIGGDGFGGERYSPLGDESSSAAYQIISVQKSVITDYKAGRLTLEGFKQKVLQYQN
jgi:hypothetical protein